MAYTESFIEAIYRVAMFGMCKSERDKKLLCIIYEVSSKYGVSLSTTLDLLQELDSRVKQLGGVEDA